MVVVILVVGLVVIVEVVILLGVVVVVAAAGAAVLVVVVVVVVVVAAVEITEGTELRSSNSQFRTRSPKRSNCPFGLFLPTRTAPRLDVRQQLQQSTGISTDVGLIRFCVIVPYYRQQNLIYN
jgi:hypothetical protein